MIQVNSQKYAIVDLEATGAHAMAEIIQVGIVIIENDEIVKTYQTDVNPHEALSEHIINYRRKRFKKEYDVKYFKLSCGISLNKFLSSKKIFKQLFNILNEKL